MSPYKHSFTNTYPYKHAYTMLKKYNCTIIIVYPIIFAHKQSNKEIYKLLQSIFVIEWIKEME